MSIPIVIISLGLIAIVSYMIYSRMESLKGDGVVAENNSDNPIGSESKYPEHYKIDTNSQYAPMNLLKIESIIENNADYKYMHPYQSEKYLYKTLGEKLLKKPDGFIPNSQYASLGYEKDWPFHM